MDSDSANCTREIPRIPADSSFNHNQLISKVHRCIMLKPARAVFWSTIPSLICDHIISENVPVFAFAEPTNPVDKKAIVLAIRTTHILKICGLTFIDDGLNRDNGFVRIGYLRREDRHIRIDRYANKDGYFPLVNEPPYFVEGRLSVDDLTTSHNQRFLVFNIHRNNN